MPTCWLGSGEPVGAINPYEQRAPGLRREPPAHARIITVVLLEARGRIWQRSSSVFFRYDGGSRIIIYAWVSLRQRGGKSDLDEALR